MGWEFAALWNDETMPWQWVWRRIADDNGEVLEESGPFAHLEECLQDAKKHGFENDEAGPHDV